MTRLLLYRGKRMDNEEYVYGYYTGYRVIAGKRGHWILDIDDQSEYSTHFRSVDPKSITLVYRPVKETPQKQYQGYGYNNLLMIEDKL